MFERMLVRVRVFIRMRVYMHSVFTVHMRPSTCASIRASIRASRFAIAHVTPPVLSSLSAFSFHVPPTIQFIRRIILGTIVGTEGGFQPSPFLFYLVVAPVGLSRIPLPTCLRWLNRHGRFEGAIRSSWFCSNMADHVLSFISRLDDNIVSHYFLLLWLFIVLILANVFMMPYDFFVYIYID